MKHKGLAKSSKLPAHQMPDEDSLMVDAAHSGQGAKKKSMTMKGMKGDEHTGGRAAIRGLKKKYHKRMSRIV